MVQSYDCDGLSKCTAKVRLTRALCRDVGRENNPTVVKFDIESRSVDVCHCDTTRTAFRIPSYLTRCIYLLVLESQPPLKIVDLII